MNDMFIPQSTQALILKEREKMLNNVVKLIGKMSEEVAGSMMGNNLTEVQEKVVAEPQEINAVQIIEKTVEKVLDGQLKSLLHDVDYRINVLYDALNRAEGKEVDRVGSKDLNLAHHILDGFTFTNNSPVAGSIAWAGCHIVYKGTDYTISDNNTALKYVWWDYDAVPNTNFQTSATKPTLTVDDVLVAINDGGVARLTMVPGKMTHGSALLDSTVNTNELADSAVNSDKIAALAVIEGKLAAGAVTNAKLGDGAVTTVKIGDSQITGPKIGAGQVAESKLNVATHFMY